MAPLGLSPSQMHALLLMSYILLGALSVAALLLVIRAAFVWIPAMLNRRRLHHRNVTSTNVDHDGRNNIIPRTVDTDPFQTPEDSAPVHRDGTPEPPEWVVEYQHYLESLSRPNKRDGICPSSLMREGLASPMNTYPRGLGILVEPAPTSCDDKRTSLVDRASNEDARRDIQWIDPNRESPPYRSPYANPHWQLQVKQLGSGRGTAGDGDSGKHSSRRSDEPSRKESIV